MRKALFPCLFLSLPAWKYLDTKLVWKGRNVYLHWDCLIVGWIEDQKIPAEKSTFPAPCSHSLGLVGTAERQEFPGCWQTCDFLFSCTKARSPENCALWSSCWSLLHAKQPSRNTEAAMACPIQWWRISLAKIHYKTLREAPKHSGETFKNW